MLPARARMRRSGEFADTVRRGRRGPSRSVVVHLTPDHRATAADTRVGFVVGKAVGSATVRNLVRRRLRHLVRARLDTLPPGAALVVRAHPDAATLSSAELGRDLDRALQRALSPAPATPSPQAGAGR